MRKAFNFYFSHWEQMQMLDDIQIAQLTRAICSVQFLEKEISEIDFEDKMLALAWAGIKHSLNTSIEGYKAKTKTPTKGEEDTPSQGDIHPPSVGGRQGGSNTPTQEEKGKEKEEGQVKEEEEVQQGREKFVPPTLSQVEDYVKEKSLLVEAEHFFNFFEVGKWKDTNGKQVKNWKQKLLTWRNHSEKSPKKEVRWA